MSAEPTLAIDGLEVTFDTDDGPLRAVDGVDLELGAGEIVALVGESGSGKSVTALSVLGLSRSRGTHFGGEIRYGGRNLLDLSENELRSVRGAEIAMVFQDPLTALNPVRRWAGRSRRCCCCTPDLERSEAGDGRSSCSAGSESPTPSAVPSATPTSSRAACASG